MEYYSAIKKNEIMSSEAIWMDLEISYLVKQVILYFGTGFIYLYTRILSFFPVGGDEEAHIIDEYMGIY